MTFLFDTNLGAPVASPETKDGRQGGAFFGTTSPVISSSVTLGGATASLPTNNATVGLIDFPGLGQGFYVHGYTHWNDPAFPAGTVFGLELLANFWSPGFSVPATLDTPFSLPNIGAQIGQPGNVQFASFLVRRCSVGNVCTDAEIQMSIDSFSLASVPAAVPLPATGLLLVGGLGAVGALRRGKRRWANSA